MVTFGGNREIIQVNKITSEGVLLILYPFKTTENNHYQVVEFVSFMDEYIPSDTGNIHRIYSKLNCVHTEAILQETLQTEVWNIP